MTFRTAALTVALATMIFAQDPDPVPILYGVIMRQNRLLEELKDIIITGDYEYREMNRNGKIEKTINSQRLIYRKGPDQEYSEVVSLRLNGEALDPAGVKREVDNLKKQGKRTGKTRMPYWERWRSDYDYAVLGERVWNGIDAWAIAFTARKADKGYINGTMIVSRDSFDILELDFKPTKVPSVIRNMNFKIVFARTYGWWLPARFNMELYLKVQVIINLVEKRITVEERYSDYKLYNLLPDSLFDGREGF